MCKVSPAMAAGRAEKNRNSKTNQKRVIRIFQRLMFVVFYAARYPSKKFCRQNIETSECLVAFIHLQ